MSNLRQNKLNQALRFLGILFISLFLWKLVSDFYLDLSISGEIFGKFSLAWFIVFLTWVAFCCSIGLISATAVLRGEIPHWIFTTFDYIKQHRFLAVFIAILLLFGPSVILLWTRLGDYLLTPAIRLVILLTSGIGLSLLFSCHRDRLGDWHEIAFGILAAASVFYISVQFVNVTNYPFTLGWSEGNRFYDYSLIFGSDRYLYPYKITLRKDIGRQLLWGLPYLIPHTQIWLHRLWNAVLATGPSLILAYVLAIWSQLSSQKRWTLTLFFFLFISQGPIYTPLILSALVTVLGVSRKNWFRSAFVAGLAGYYACLSRFTWLPAVPIWAVFILLNNLDFEGEIPSQRTSYKNRWNLGYFKRLLPIFLVALAGLVGGLLANPTLLQPSVLVGSTSFAQPLLWYRLFPNSTYSEGVLGGLVLACGPLAVILLWRTITKRWRLHWLLALAYLGACLVLLAGGLVASVKIGGGNNLHNLDMFFISLAILSGLALRDSKELFVQNWPKVCQGLLFMAILVPVWSASRLGTRLVLPPVDTQNKALSVLEERIKSASQQGPVLFLDQRQLLTFGYIRNVELVPEYEKKYVMDQAMAMNEEYFKDFYKDLENKRFSLIITDPLFTKLKEGEYDFSEENNAWVGWVSRPLLCYYAPVRNIPDNVLAEFKIQLLVPRQNPKECPL